MTSRAKQTQSENEKSTTWSNDTEQILVEMLGRQEYEKRLATQYDDAYRGKPTPGGLVDNLQIRVLKLFSTHFHTDDPRTRPLPVGGVGFASVVNNPHLPEHPFFRAGRSFRIRLHHKNLTQTDDRCDDVRVTCIKLSDRDTGGELDLVLYTGAAAPYYNSSSLQAYIKALKEGESAVQTWAMEKPCNYFGLVEGLRRLPASYHALHYYTHINYVYTTSEHTRYAARMRVVPAHSDDVTESGLLWGKQQRMVWSREPVMEDNRSSTYLRSEYTDKMMGGRGYEYMLQVQLYPLQTSQQHQQQQQHQHQQQQQQQGGNDAANNNKRSHLTTPTTQKDNNDGERQHYMNATQPWPAQHSSPWIDLCTITVTSLLERVDLMKTCLNLTTHPPSFSLPDVHNADDFTSLSYAMAELHNTPHVTKNEDSSAEIEESLLASYQITVHTGDVTGSGTDGDVWVILTGAKGRTAPIYLDNALHDDFEAGSADTFDARARHVGQLQTVQVELKSSSLLPNRCWLLTYISVCDVTTQDCSVFPCYQWFTAQVPIKLLRTAQSLLQKDEQCRYLSLCRAHHVSKKRDSYTWLRHHWLPSSCVMTNGTAKTRSRAVYREQEVDTPESLYSAALNSTGATGINLTAMFDSWDILKDCEKLLRNQKVGVDLSVLGYVTAKWRDDVEFGRQLLNGAHPLRIRRLQDHLPAGFTVDREKIGKCLKRGLSLEEEIKRGFMYIVSYPELSALHKDLPSPAHSHQTLHPAACLLYLQPEDKSLVPVAIQLHLPTHAQGDSSSSDAESSSAVTFTPQDSAPCWMVAKMAVRQADAITHLISSRYTCGNLVMEAVATAAYRNLPSVHPVYKLLHPHLSHLAATSQRSRSVLFGQSGLLYKLFNLTPDQVDSVMRESYKRFRWEDLDLPRDLMSRKVIDPIKLPGYCYRDDGLQMWKIIEKMVRTVVMLHYWEDEQVIKDQELQDFVRELHDVGLPGNVEEVKVYTSTSHGVPKQLSSIKQLINFITIVLFTTSGRHAALTSGLLDYYGFIPNAPTRLTMQTIDLHSPQNITERTILATCLPNKQQAAQIIASLVALRTSYCGCTLEAYPEQHWSTEPLRSTMIAFHEELVALSSRIRRRNEAGPQSAPPYVYLCPDNVHIGLSV